MNYELTQSQVDHYQENGFVVIDDFFWSDIVLSLTHAIDIDLLYSPLPRMDKKYDGQADNNGNYRCRKVVTNGDATQGFEAVSIADI